MPIKFDKDQNKAINKKAYNRANAGSTGYHKTILANQLDEAFKRFNGDFEFIYEPKKSDQGWHPSGDCLPPVSYLWGKAYASLHPETATVPGKDLSHLNKIFMVGHYWHQIIQHIIITECWAAPSAIEGIGYRTWDDEGEYIYTVGSHADQSQVDTAHNSNYESVKPFHYVRGQGDVAPLIMSSWAGLVDIKTMNPDDFKRGLLQSRFANKYLAQINIYMDLFDLDQALILAVDKGSSAFAEYTFVRDQKLIDQIYTKWERVSWLLDHDQEPSSLDDNMFELYIGDE
jgi:hypothetical protein